MREFVAGPNDAGVRLSRFVQMVTQNLPDTLLYKSLRKRRVKVNGKRAEPGYRLAEGDVIQLYLNDEFFVGAPARALPPPAGAPPFATVWEDARLAILYKPAGLLSHGDAPGVPSLLDAFTSSLIARGEFSPAAENSFSPALCSRLDRNTEGLVPAAKAYPALRDMNELLRLHLVQKTYLCIATEKPPEGVHSAFLRRDKAAKTVQVTAGTQEGAKPVTTGVRIREAHGGLYLCELELITGRTHQARAHMAFLGAPLLGDAKYGARPQPGFALSLPGQALCAWQLAFAAALPAENTLQDLAGRRFLAEQARLPAWWQAFCQT